ncbi:MAG TPA: putative colanic acid biosynthesis acetyltransferase [Terriglobales bacterium]
MAPQSVARPFSETAAQTPASEFEGRRPVQDLAAFRVPARFRGRPAWFVQLWWVVHATLFRWSPQILFGWRRFLVRLFGGTVGKRVLIRPTANITYPWKVSIGNFSWIGDDVTLYSLGEIQIGNNVVISQQSYLCTGSHDMESSAFEITERSIVIEDEVWLATDVFVGPGVRIGHGAVVGVRSTVLHDLQPMLVYVGNPAKPIRPRLTHEKLA